jgi:proline iminopeptidase
MYVTVNETRLFFDVEGAKLVADGPRLHEKPTLLLLHGGAGDDHSSLRPFFSCFEPVAQVVYLDQRGHGRSERSDPETWNLKQWGDDVRGFCDALGIERPVVLGVSFGGIVAQAYATQHPAHPAKLILSSTFARQRLDRTLAAFERLGGAAARDAAARFLTSPTEENGTDYWRTCRPLYWKRARPDPEAARRVRRNPDLLFHFFAGEAATFDLLPALPRVECPVLVLAGGDDPIATPDDARDIVQALPSGNARLELFAGCGHFLRYEDPQRFHRVVAKFIESGL